jgi:SAM-dependent methyltransferase
MRIELAERDPLGEALLAYQRGQKKAVIQVYSDIAIDDVIPVRYMFRVFDEMPAWEQIALRSCQGRVLDIGAGAGGHALWLEAQGHEVVAMDVSPGAVAAMQARGVKQPLHADIQGWQPGERFDTLLLMMNGIGLVGDLHGLHDFLVEARSWLHPGGQILLDSSDLRYLYEAEQVSLPLPDGRYHGIVHYQMTFGAVQGESFAWLYLDCPKLTRQAAHAGWTCECIAQGPHHEYLARLTLASERQG